MGFEDLMINAEFGCKNIMRLENGNLGSLKLLKNKKGIDFGCEKEEKQAKRRDLFNDLPRN